MTRSPGAPDNQKHAEFVGRFKARFKPGRHIRVFHEGEMMDVIDISEAGCRLATQPGRFDPEHSYALDLVFQDQSEVSGWRIRAECRWARLPDEAGFAFDLARLGRTIGNRIARQHLRSGLRILNGLEL